MALSIEQQKAIALAKARQRKSQQVSMPVQPPRESRQGAVPLEQVNELNPLPVNGRQDFTGLDEAALSIASGLAGTIGGGLAGLAAGGDAQVVRDVQEKLTYQPKSEAGKKTLQTVGDLIQAGVDVVNYPISGLAGLAELVTGQGIDRAAQTVESIQDIGTGKTAGERVFQETGSPALATLAETSPDILLSALPLKAKAGKAPSITGDKLKNIEQAIKAGESAKVPVLTSDIFSPNTIVGRLNQQFAEKIPFFGTGGKRGAQQTARVQALVDLDQSVPKIQASDIIENLSNSANKARKAAGKRIGDVSSRMDATGSYVAVDNTLKSIDDVLEQLTRAGKIKDEGLINEINTLKSTLNESPQSFSSLREFRTDARAIADRVDAAGRSQVRSTDKAKLDKIINGITDDLDKFVLQNEGARGLQRYKVADRVYADEFSKLTKSRLKTILDKGDVNPELVNNLLFSSSPSQVKLLFNNLDSAGRKNARYALYRKALDNSVTAGKLSPEKFVTQLNKLEDNFNVFFRGTAKDELAGLKKLLESTQRASEAGVATQTGQTLQATLGAGVLGGALIGDPKSIATLFTAGTLGLGNKIYESKGVRDMLIRLGKSQKRSTLEADLLKSIPVLVESSNLELLNNSSESQNRE